MNRVQEELEYWDGEANSGHIKRSVCDPGLEEFCFHALDSELKKGKILEIGCGIGRMINEIASRKGYGKCTFYGIDISESMLNSVNRHKLPKQKVVYLKCDGRSIPYQKEKFDSVFSVAVFQHIDDEGVIQYIKEAFRVLKFGGRFRFQFVEGEEKIAFSWQRRRVEVFSWLIDNGFKIESIDERLVFENWVWVTAVKLEKES